MNKDITKEKIQKFMYESNSIEGEPGVSHSDMIALKKFLMEDEITEKNVLEFHRGVTQHLKVDWSGKYREVQVRVGNHVPPPPELVNIHMAEFFRFVNEMDSWIAHNKFQDIHPFQDFNGRVGRAIWLKRFLEEGGTLSLSFLHQYYYQTLAHERQ